MKQASSAGCGKTCPGMEVRDVPKNHILRTYKVCQFGDVEIVPQRAQMKHPQDILKKATVGRLCRDFQFHASIYIQLLIAKTSNKDLSLVTLINIYQDVVTNKYFGFGYVQRNRRPLYTKPLDSSHINIFIYDKISDKNELTSVPVDDILYKSQTFVTEEGIISFSLLHC